MIAKSKRRATLRKRRERSRQVRRACASGRNGGAPGGFIELGHGGLCRLLVFDALRFHHFGRKTILSVSGTSGS